MKNLQKFTVEEFQKNFDSLLEEVEKGRSFLIESDSGDVVIQPCNSEITDEFIKIHQNHEEAS